MSREVVRYIKQLFPSGIDDIIAKYALAVVWQGALVSAMDRKGNWLNARVKSCNGEEFDVHFTRWNPRYDEIVPRLLIRAREPEHGVICPGSSKGWQNHKNAHQLPEVKRLISLGIKSDLAIMSYFAFRDDHRTIDSMIDFVYDC
jgi:hypothetical protein